MAPQLGTSITGGNATLGQAGSLGGLGHFLASASESTRFREVSRRFRTSRRQ